MHDAALQALKYSFLAACCLILTTRAASAEDNRPAPPASGGAAIPTPSNQVVREAAARAVRLIDRTSAGFLTTRACFTCHTQTLSAMVLSDARKVGFEIDEANFKRQYERAFEALSATRVDTMGYALWALDIGRYVPDGKSEAMVEYLLNYQKDLGTWNTTVHRPPAEASHFTTNYVALRGLNRYATAKQREAVATRATAIKRWLESAIAADTVARDSPTDTNNAKARAYVLRPSARARKPTTPSSADGVS